MLEVVKDEVISRCKAGSAQRKQMLGMMLKRNVVITWAGSLVVRLDPTNILNLLVFQLQNQQNLSISTGCLAVILKHRAKFACYVHP